MTRNEWAADILALIAMALLVLTIAIILGCWH